LLLSAALKLPIIRIMTEDQYRSLVEEAENLCRISPRPAYWEGYMQGLKRFYFGPETESIKEHEEWLARFYRVDETGVDRGRGYMDGLMGVRPVM
jgi:hypothetical protein